MISEAPNQCYTESEYEPMNIVFLEKHRSSSFMSIKDIIYSTSTTHRR